MSDIRQVLYDIERCICHVPDACKDCSKYKGVDDELRCMEELMADALELLKEQPQWISVKDDLPKERDSIFANFKHLSKHMWAKESDKVIVYVRFPDGTGTSTEGRLQDGKWWTRVSPTLEPVVTHWMPFPEPPEKRTDSKEQREERNTKGK